MLKLIGMNGTIVRGDSAVIRELLDIDDLVEQGKREAQKLGRPVLISHVMPIPPLDPLSFYVAARPWFKGKRIYWSIPDQELVFVGLGAAYTIESEEPNRFEDLCLKWENLCKHTIFTHNASTRGTGPLLLGGFSFDAQVRDPLWTKYKPASFCLPQILLTKQEKTQYLTINMYLDPHREPHTTEGTEVIQWSERLIQRSQNVVLNTRETPNSLHYTNGDLSQWTQRVRQAVNIIRKKRLQKVVLSRRVEVTGNAAFQAEQILFNLIKNQKTSYVFAIERDQYVFIGASPERLIKKEGSTLISTCLAGSIARGKTPEEDVALSRQLLADQKNRLEHQIVVQMIKESLENVCVDLQVSREPIILKTSQIQHLYTPVKGMIKPNVPLISLIEKLHPTPALGGYPKEEALQVIRDLEPFDRGWYAAPLGWVDNQNNGEFAVAIRSGLISGHKAVLYAGCGIVAESDPVTEYEETVIKLKPMLSALGGSNP
jgi:menaquinone-specific isochorismate synthase